MIDWVTKTFLAKYLKGVLDKLPFDGKKTLLSAILYALFLALPAVPSGPIHEGMQLFISIFQSMGVTAPTDDAAKAALLGVLVGLFHKALKFLDSKVNPSGLPPAKQ